MSSCLSIHINFLTEADAMRDFILAARPVIAKTLHHDAGFWREIKAEYPGLLLVGRRYVEKQPLSNPENEAEQFARGILDTSTARICGAWEGYNESPRSKLEARCRFDRRLAELLHAEGLKYVAGSWSVGVPDIPDWRKPEMLDALRVADYIGVHEYCAPRMDSEFLRYPDDPDIQPEVGGYFTLRYRKWWPTLPPDCQKPVIISECGIDSGAARWDPGAQGGWRSFTKAQGYLEQLKWYDRHLQEDDYAAGAAIFCWGTLDRTWDSYDIRGEMAERLKAYIVSQREVEPVPPEFPVTPEGWIDVRNWLTKHPTKRYEERLLAAIDTVVIHHVGAVPKVGSGEELCECIANWHVWGKTATKGEWPGIGYCFVITFGGQTFLTQDLHAVAFHVGEQHNRHCVGVCFEGCFMPGNTPREPNRFQIAAARKLLEDLKGHVAYKRVVRHRDLAQTECPGDTSAVWMRQLFPPPEEDWEGRALRAEGKLGAIRDVLDS